MVYIQVCKIICLLVSIYFYEQRFQDKGQVNMTYVNEMLKIIDLLEYYGMYVIIDLHQDMMSSKFNSYDGMIHFIFSNFHKLIGLSNLN